MTLKIRFVWGHQTLERFWGQHSAPDFSENSLQGVIKFLWICVGSLKFLKILVGIYMGSSIY